MTARDWAKQILMTDLRAPVSFEKKLKYLTESIKRVIEDCAVTAEKVAACYSANNGDNKEVALLVAEDIRALKEKPVTECLSSKLQGEGVSKRKVRLVFPLGDLDALQEAFEMAVINVREIARTRKSEHTNGYITMTLPVSVVIDDNPVMLPTSTKCAECQSYYATGTLVCASCGWKLHRKMNR